MKKSVLFLGVLLGFAATQSHAAVVDGWRSFDGSVGLVWNGDGACNDGCWQAAANIVKKSGLKVRYVNENTPASSPTEVSKIFSDARVWIMPGGYAAQEVEAMTPLLKRGLRNFISHGGGYVGWCAGAFAATSSIGEIHKPGLGIFPGLTELYLTETAKNKQGASIEKLKWFNRTRYFYFEGGASFTGFSSDAEEVAYYDDEETVAAARAEYGKGRVFVTGVHPEAPLSWWLGTSIFDPDGPDYAYAVDMVRWAAQLE